MHEPCSRHKSSRRELSLGPPNERFRLNPLLPANKVVWEFVCYRESIYRHIIMDSILLASQADGIGAKTTSKEKESNTFFASVCNQGSLLCEGLLKSWA